MLPLLIGAGVTVAALSVKSGISAWIRYTHLTPVEFAKLNGIILEFSSPDNNLYKDGKIDRDLLRRIQRYPGGFLPTLTENEACLILNISQEEMMKLDESMIKRKHRKSIILNHPDRGGSPYVAMKINTAKEVLLKSYLLRK